MVIPYEPAVVDDPTNDLLPPRTFVIYDGADMGIACPIFAFAHPREEIERSRIAIPLAPSPRGWQWNGDRVRPTLSPSVRITDNRPWHGMVQDGVFTDA